MKRLPFFIAYRYLFKTAYEQSIGTMVIISFLGIFIGTVALTLVAAITKGFETEIHKKIQGVHAQIIIRANSKDLEYPALSTILKNEFPEVTWASPSSTKHGIIRSTNEHHNAEQSSVVLIRAIDPDLDEKVTVFYKKIIAPQKTKKHLFDFLQDDNILIGSGIAEALGLSVGDEIELLIPEDTQKKSKKVSFTTQKAIISGIFKTGIDDADTGIIVCSFSFLEDVFGETPVDQVNLKLASSASEQEVINRLNQRTNLDVYAWRDLYPALVAALALEKYVSFAILALVALVASMNMVSLIFMLITQKRADIAILKACGASTSTVSLIFLTVGMFITITAALLGLGTAFFISQFLKTHPFIKLPDAYLVTHLPIDLTFSIIITVFCLVCLLGFFAACLPVRKIKVLNIADVLRFEA